MAATVSVAPTVIQSAFPARGSRHGAQLELRIPYRGNADDRRKGGMPKRPEPDRGLLLGNWNAARVEQLRESEQVGTRQQPAQRIRGAKRGEKRRPIDVELGEQQEGRHQVGECPSRRQDRENGLDFGPLYQGNFRRKQRKAKQ